MDPRERRVLRSRALSVSQPQPPHHALRHLQAPSPVCGGAIAGRPSEASPAAFRYVYLTTGAKPALVDTRSHPDALNAQRGGDTIVLASPGSALLADAQSLLAPEDAAAVANATSTMDQRAEAGHHSIHIVQPAPGRGGSVALIVGAGEFGRLYGVYTAAEQLGVRFELTGDILPDPTQDGGLPLAACAKGGPLPLKSHDYASPMFDFRGLQPFQ